MIDGYVVQVRDEDDGDVHIVIADADGYTMIIEFPDPACMRGSRVLAQATKAKQRLMQLLGRGPVTGDLKIRVTGVVFFDKYHRQSGVASNAVELHPVLAVRALEEASHQQPLPPAAAQTGPARSDDQTDIGGVARHAVTHPPQGACCKICRTSQPCGDSSISRAFTCHKAPGCACPP
jgi:hypothetical protein